MQGDRSTLISAQLIAGLVGVRAPAGLPRASGVSFHSGRLKPGEAFFALPGAREHGITHAPYALSRGASFIVSDRPHPLGITVPDPEAALLALGRHARQRITGAVVGISGSAGKTTTKALAAAALDAWASPGNLNTPRALACTMVAAWLSDPRRPLVLELGIDRPGEMDELVDLVRPSHGLLTLIAESHLEALGDIAGVAREKARLLERSPERLSSYAAATRLPRPLPGLLSYGLDPAADISGTTSSNEEGGQYLQALGVEVPLPGRGRAFAENALGALVLAQRLGIEPSAAARRLASAKLEPGRLQGKWAGDRLILDDSYNSNPASALAAIEVLRASPAPHCAVLGDMLELGEESPRFHRELGAATMGLHRVIAVGPAAAAIKEGNPRALHAQTVEQAIELLHELPRRGTVLVKGSRGMKLERLARTLCEEGNTW